MNCGKPCKNPKSTLVSVSCQPLENKVPLKQKIAIHSIKYIPTKTLTHKILRKITENCSKWTEKKNSKKDIISFIKEYNINWKEASKCQGVKTLEKCASRFETKNDFFARERVGIKVEGVEDEKVIVSPCDCRLVMYEKIKKAKEYWIKGRGFTVKKLLGGQFSDRFSKIIVCRLAIEDYHRFHFPIDCVYMGFYKIDGEYYSVDHRIVNSKIDAFGDNKREVHMLYNPFLGNVFCVVISATCTGSIETDLKEGETYRKGDLFGKFGFGGSTVVVLLEKGMDIKLCENFKKNSEKGVETYVRVGTFLGSN